MKAARLTIVVGLVVVIACAINSLVPRRPAQPQAPRQAPNDGGRVDPGPPREPAPTAAAPANPSPRRRSSDGDLLPASRPAVEARSAENSPVPRPSAAAQARKAPKPSKRPPEAALPRMALSFVGFDPEAEEIWYNGINDPSLSANARKDLIEDLNEDGFPDPHNITMDDLPLIVNRLQLIEALAPEAMDAVNADAFAEAYKDLVNMYNRLSGQ